MLDVKQILDLQTATVELWHSQNIKNPYADILGLVCQQHAYNFQLWHQEDIARSPAATDSQIAEVKRNIDKLNQARNDYIEKVDDWIADYLQQQKIVPCEQARQNTETCGSVIDRLSIMSLRIYHYHEQTLRADATDEHRMKTVARLKACQTQRCELGIALASLVDDLALGRAIHRIYRQFKMYNDPSLNPQIYSAKKNSPQTS